MFREVRDLVATFAEKLDLQLELGVFLRTAWLQLQELLGLLTLHPLAPLDVSVHPDSLDLLQWKFRLSVALRWIDEVSNLLVRTSWP